MRWPFGWGICDVCDEDEASGLDRFDECGSKRLRDVSEGMSCRLWDTYQQSRAADQTHEVVVSRNLHSLLHRYRCPTAALDNVRVSGRRLRGIRAEFVAKENGVFVHVSIFWLIASLALTVGLLPVDDRAYVLVEGAEEHTPQCTVYLARALSSELTCVLENHREDVVCESVHVVRRAELEALLLESGRKKNV